LRADRSQRYSALELNVVSNIQMRHDNLGAAQSSMKLLVSSALILGVSLLLNGASGQKAIRSSAAKAAPLSTPAPQMEKLIAALAGEWSTVEKYEASDTMPKGGTGHSRDSYRAGPARLSLIEEYHGEGTAGKAWGTGVIWWDSAVQGFHFVWCDSYALDRGCRVSSDAGRWDGEDFVQTDVHEVSGKKVFEKEVWSELASNSFTQTLYVGETPGQLKRFMTIKAKRLVKRPRQ
jgi:hypothetical protein